MAGHILELGGCTPEPLGNYLKGLGVFRLIAEQADPQARAWWKNGVLWLQSKWSREEVISFFLHGIGEGKTPIYSPTPIFAPWGGRSAFLKDGGNSKAIARLKRLQAGESTSPRFGPAREAIRAATELLGRLGITTKKSREKTKQRIFAACRNEWSGSAFDWLAACVAIEEYAEYGFLFGTGGNEGSANITNNYWRFVEDAIGLPNSEPLPDSKELLAAALFASPKGPTQARPSAGETRSADKRLDSKEIPAGQHFPASTSSENYGQDYYGATAANAWDVVLMMEGGVLFAGATTKRLSQFGKGKAAFPFMLDMLCIGGMTDSLNDEAKQNQNPLEAKCQAEFWMPLWSVPSTFGDLRNLITEGRLQRPSGKPTEHTLHAKEAVAALGTARGLTAFHRVGLYRRRGDIYIATSLGYETGHSGDQRVIGLVDELAGFSVEVYRKLRLKDREDRAKARNLPERIVRARERYHQSLATLLDLTPGAAETAQSVASVLTAVAHIEWEVSLIKDREQLLNPCPALSQKAMPHEGGNTEFRLARAIAGIAAWGESSEPNRPAVEAIRSNLLPVRHRGRAWKWDETSRGAVWSHGASLSANLTSVLRRRLIDAQRGKGDGLPLWSRHGAPFSDLLAYWNGEVDESRLGELIHGLALINSGQWDQDRIDDRLSSEETPNLRTSAVWFLEDQPRITLDLPSWLSFDELQAACTLPRLYHLLKLCFVGGRLPQRPVEGGVGRRTGDEPFPPDCLDVLSLLEAERLTDAAQLAGRRLRAKGYPAVLRDIDIASLPMRLDCRRLASMMLIPVEHPGVSAALAIRPESMTA
jgi:CRISPR-associated protein Csx17